MSTKQKTALVIFGKLKGFQVKLIITVMIKKGTQVKWNWGNGTAQGKVIETFTKKVTKTIQGNEVTRNGEKGNKAIYIEQEDGTRILKSESEVQRA